MTEYTPRARCASCGSVALKWVLDLGSLPLAGCFPTVAELDATEAYPLKLAFCEACRLVQAGGVVPADLLFRDYRYLSSVGLQEHFTNLASALTHRYSLRESSLVVEMGSNDGVFLAPLKALGIPARGFEPSNNVSQIAISRGCDIIHDYFSRASAETNFKQGSVDLFFAANCFAHVDGVSDLVAGVDYLLKPGGHAVIEVHDVRNVLAQTQYDFIYLEHSFYYSLTSLAHLFEKHGLRVVDYEEIPIHGGSLRVHVARPAVKPTAAVAARLQEENRPGGAATWAAYEAFSDAATAHMQALRKMLEQCRGQGLRVVGYGASGRANVLCNTCNLGPDLVEYIVDESPERVGRFIPGVKIPIRSKAEFDTDRPPDVILLLAWNYSRRIMAKLQGHNFTYLVPFPAPRLVRHPDELQGVHAL